MMLKNKREFCELAFVVTITVILKKKKFEANIETQKKKNKRQ